MMDQSSGIYWKVHGSFCLCGMYFRNEFIMGVFQQWIDPYIFFQVFDVNQEVFGSPWMWGFGGQVHPWIKGSGKVVSGVHPWIKGGFRGPALNQGVWGGGFRGPALNQGVWSSLCDANHKGMHLNRIGIVCFFLVFFCFPCRMVELFIWISINHVPTNYDFLF